MQGSSYLGDYLMSAGSQGFHECGESRVNYLSDYLMSAGSQLCLEFLASKEVCIQISKDRAT